MSAPADTTIGSNERSRPMVLRPIAVAMVATACALLATACGGDSEPTEYGIENRNDFLTACARPLDDPRLLNDVCACAYDRIEAEYNFEDFAELDQELSVDYQANVDSATDTGPSIVVTGLPSEIIDIVADCFVEEAEL